MPPQYVKAYVKTNQHDAADAEACCEAVRRPGMRVVPVMTEAQQATLMLHRVRDQLIGQRTATINALRGHLTELGIVSAQRQPGVRQLLAVIGEVEDDRNPPPAREVLQTLATRLRELESRLAALDRRLVARTRIDPVCRALSEVPGVGPVIATAFAATVPDPRAFRSGRHLAAWLGLVPRQQASGGKARQLGLSKRGDGYLRRQLIHGAWALVWRTPAREGRLRAWIGRSTSRSRPWPTSWRASSGRCSPAGRPIAPWRSGAPTNLPRAARANVEVVADRSDRGQQSPWWSTSPRARSHDRRLACGSHQGQRPCAPHPHRPHEWLQPRRCHYPTKPLRSARHPWMDHQCEIWKACSVQQIVVEVCSRSEAREKVAQAIPEVPQPNPWVNPALSSCERAGEG
jgi:transposase